MFIRCITTENCRVKNYGFLAGMDSQVNDESLFDGERFAANFAAKRLESSVTGQMGLESAHLSEGLLANIALEPANEKKVT